MKNNRIVALLVLLVPMSSVLLSMNDALEDRVNYVDDSMLNRLDRQYLDEESQSSEDDEYGYTVSEEDEEDLMDEFSDLDDEDYDAMEEDWDEDEYPDYDEEDFDYDDEGLPEQDEAVELLEMEPQEDVNAHDARMM